MSRVVVDMMGREMTVPEHPQRIISLVPSQTELLYDLGLSDRVVGVTRFCIHPDYAGKKASIVGGTKQIQLERIQSLQPDLVLGNKEENDQESIEAIAAHVPVWMSDIHTLEDALFMIDSFGALLQQKDQSASFKQQIETLFGQWQIQRPQRPINALYLIWARPWMGVASFTFINHMLGLAGFNNVLSAYSRYPVLDEAQLQQLHPDVVLMSSEPFPFKPDHFQQMENLFPSARILPVDGELFSWYGSRLLHTPRYFQELINEIRMP